MEQEGFFYQVGDYEGEAVPEAYLHDARQLPHLIGGDLRLLFPRAVAADELDELPEEPDWLEQRDKLSREEIVESLHADTKVTQAYGHALTADSCQSVVRPRLGADLIAKSVTKPAPQRRKWRPLSHDV